MLWFSVLGVVMRVDIIDSNITSDGHSILQYILENDNGIVVEIITQGAAITKFLAPDKNGKMENIVLCYDDVEQYIKNADCLGAIAGRTAGRISGASFTINNQKYELESNEGNNVLHGGKSAFHLKNWYSKTIDEKDRVGVELSHISPDGEGGYPARIETKVVYYLDNSDTLHMDIFATTDGDTLFDVANHSYFNLDARLECEQSNFDRYTSIDNHKLQIHSSKFIPVRMDGCAMGMIAGVDGTAFDVRSLTRLADRIHADETQIKRRGGYDHPFLLDVNNGDDAENIANITLVSEDSGRILTITTDREAVVVYTANHLSHRAICFETQSIPDAINHRAYDCRLLTKKQPYHSHTKYNINLLK